MMFDEVLMKFDEVFADEVLMMFEKKATSLEAFTINTTNYQHVFEPGFDEVW